MSSPANSDSRLAGAPQLRELRELPRSQRKDGAAAVAVLERPAGIAARKLLEFARQPIDASLEPQQRFRGHAAKDAIDRAA